MEALQKSEDEVRRDIRGYYEILTHDGGFFPEVVPIPNGLYTSGGTYIGGVQQQYTGNSFGMMGGGGMGGQMPPEGTEGTPFEGMTPLDGTEGTQTARMDCRDGNAVLIGVNPVVLRLYRNTAAVYGQMQLGVKPIVFRDDVKRTCTQRAAGDVH